MGKELETLVVLILKYLVQTMLLYLTGLKLTFNKEMRGSAEIVTEGLRLIERVFYQFRELFKYQ